MKKFAGLFLLSFFLSTTLSFAAVKNFQGEGEVLSVDPVYSRVTIHHAPIKGFAGGPETDFPVKSADLLKKISKSDLVSFEIEERNGDAEITRIERTGQAAPKEEGVPLGRTAQGVLESAGGVVKAVTSPITPVHEVASATTDATTSTTGAVLNEANPDVKTKF